MYDAVIGIDCVTVATDWTRRGQRGLRLEPGALRMELDGKLADPATALPILERAVALRRALSGIAGAGPFR